MILLEKNSSENSRAYALRVLLYNIIHLELEPGSALSESEMSGILSLSRTPVREAFIELSQLGLVEILPQRGSYISKINYELVEESRFFRLIIERAILRQICQGIDAEYVKLLEDSVSQQKIYLESGDRDRFLELDNEFHRLLFQAAGKMWTYGIVKQQMVHFDRLRSLLTISTSRDYVLSDHEDILYAIKRQDPEMADLLITRHLTRDQAEKPELVRLYPAYFTD